MSRTLFTTSFVKTFGVLLVSLLASAICRASTVATPTFSPAAGTYTSNQNVTISDSTSGATIYYTTNGSTPTTSSTQYTGTITVSATETIKAIGVKSGFTNSSVGSATYTLKAATPTFSLAAGTYTSPQTVTISDSTSGATIYYTTNGSTPTTSSTQYTGPITVSATETVKAIAALTGYSNSSTASAAYTLQVVTPSFSPGAGTYTSPQTVTISDSTSGSNIYYTTNGTTPTTGSSRYTGPITVGASETVKAIATATGYSQSAVGPAVYTINLTAANPTFSPPGGNYSSALAVSINDSTPGVTIYYTKDGTTPTTSSPIYTGAITLSSTTTIEALGTESGYAQSGVVSATYALPSQTSTSTTMSVTSGGNSVTSVTQGSVVALTATVSSSGSPVTSGTVEFCNANATYCEDINLIGTAQLTSAGTAAIDIIPSYGVHNYKAVLVGNLSYLSSSSSVAALLVTPLIPTATTIATTSSGYPLTATVSGPSNLSAPPSGTVSFIDTSNNNTQLGAATLSGGTGGGNPSQSIAFNNLSTFTFPATESTDSSLVALGDFNGDGNIDVAVFSESPSVSVYLGNGNGTFAAAPGGPMTLSDYPNAIAAGDFNGDGKLDLAVVGTDGNLAVLLGSGNGAFTAESRVFTDCYSPISLTVADFNRDGKLDFAVPCSDTSSNHGSGIIVMLGAGNGTFSPAYGTPVAFSDGVPSAAVVGDFNADGIPDLATANGESGTVSILLGNGDGTFTEASGSPITTGNILESLVTADFNGDGYADLAVADWYDAQVKVFYGNGNGTLTSEFTLYVGKGPFAMAAADFNMDGVPDLAIANEYDGTVSYLVSNASHPLTAQYTVNANAGSQDLEGSWNLNGPYSLAAADFNGDGIPDLAAIIPGSGTQSTGYLLGTSLTQLSTASFTGNSPAGGGIHNIEAVYNADTSYAGSTSSTTPLSVPWISNIAPSGGLPESIAAITGSNFGSSSNGGSVTFNGSPATIMGWTPNSVQVMVPIGATTGPAVVSLNGSNSNSVTFTVPNVEITGVSPVSGPVGTNVTVSGIGFGASGTLTFNGVAASPTNWTPETIIVPVPAGATTGPIVVNSGAASYNFTVTPGISAIAPVQGVAGISVTITGTTFGATQGTSSVLFNGTPAQVTSWSNTSIVVTAPTSGTTGAVTVVVNGASAVGPAFTFAPSISSLMPTSGSVGALVKISGSGFGYPQGYSSVGFGSVIATPTQWLQDAIVVPVPTGAVTGSVVVYAGGQASNAVPFTVSGSASGGAGTISGSVTQSDGVTAISGAVVTVLQGGMVVGTTASTTTGSYALPNLSPGTYGVQASAFGYGAMRQSSVSVTANQTTTENFALAGQTSITYTYDALGRLTGVSDPTNGSAMYTYDPVGNILSISRASTGQISILNFTPSTGLVGSSVTISGTSFSANPSQDSVSFNGTAATLTSATASQLVATVPTGATTGPITVTAPSGTVTSTTSFTVASSASTPSITSFSPAMASPGGSVTLTGLAFDVIANDIVEFDGVSAFVSSASPTSISTTVPANALSGPISLTTPYGTSTTASNFVVVPAPYTSSQVDFTSQMTVGGAPYSGTISNSGDIGILLFNGIQGQELDLNVNNSSIASANILILNPNGSTLVQSTIGNGNASIDTLPIPASGIYTILVESSGTTGSLTLNLSQISLPSIASGTPQPVTLAGSGQTAQFTFTGIAGQTASVQISSSTFCSQVSILNPDGSTLVSGGTCASSYLVGPAALPTSGSYTVVISGGSGTATVLLSLFNNQKLLTVSGTATAIQINIPGQNVQMAFLGTTGQLVSVQLSNSTFCSQVTVLNPDGSTLMSGGSCSSGVFVGPATLPSSGAYTLVIGAGVATGSANVLLSLFSEQTGQISSGVAVPITISIPGQNVQLTFTGTAGQSANLQLSNSTFCSQLSILNPDGSTLASGGSCGSSVSVGPATVQGSGTYTVVVAASNGATGTANITLTLQ